MSSNGLLDNAPFDNVFGDMFDDQLYNQTALKTFLSLDAGAEQTNLIIGLLNVKLELINSTLSCLNEGVTLFNEESS